MEEEKMPDYFERVYQAAVQTPAKDCHCRLVTDGQATGDRLLCLSQYEDCD